MAKPTPLAAGFIEEGCRGACDVQGIDRDGHGYGHRIIAQTQNWGGNPVTFTAENHTHIAGKVRVRQCSSIHVRMRGNTPDAL